MRENCVIKTENLTKEYKLGKIGTGSLIGDIQSRWSKKFGAEDKSEVFANGEKIRALDGLSIEIERGERVGILGANGAGKSTLLKLLSRITSPTDGTITYRGRIASMLEVGTGFQGELTGRENIYLNGAILGMSKSEINAKMDKIIEFSECEKFIDTPVKRYSSGMFVKLAFAVASHLDAEIMIMDEVLAVGDMQFQKKCIQKMRELAQSESRTVLYVSHNMSTIRELCNRCIVLSNGKMIYDGGVEEAIKIYLGSEQKDFCSIKYPIETAKNADEVQKITLKSAKYYGKTDNIFYEDEKLHLELSWKNNADISNLCLRIEVSDYRQYPVTAYIIEDFYSGAAGEDHTQKFALNISRIVRGKYYTRYVLYNRSSENAPFKTLQTADGLAFRRQKANENKILWQKSWGSIAVDKIELE